MASGLWSIEVTQPSETPAGETTVRRSALSPHALTETPHPSIHSIFDLVQFNGRRWGDSPCFGTRNVIKVHTEKMPMATRTTKTEVLVPQRPRMFWELGHYEFRSYKEVVCEGLNLGAGLRRLGLVKGDKVSIYADTSYVPRVF